MKKILIWGVTYQADLAFHFLQESYDIIGFYDNDSEKQGKLYQNLEVFSLEELIKRKDEFEVVIAVSGFIAQIERQCHELEIKVLGIYNDGKLEEYVPLHFEDLLQRDSIYLYAGDVPSDEFYKDKIGLSIHKADSRHIYHNVLWPYPLADNSVNAYMAEDVFEHLPYDELVKVFNEIYRILKPGGLFRLALPDYRNDIMNIRSLKDKNGNILFDPSGGGSYKDGIIINGGHLWFPVYESVQLLIEKSEFSKYEFLHYNDPDGNSVTRPIDYAKGYVKRTPDHDERVKEPYRALSIVVDMYK